MVRDVVFTVTLKVTGTLALNVSLVGTAQFAPVGAPVQLIAADPLVPAPPRESVYDAACPAITVAEFGSPGGTLSPRLEV